MRITENEIKKDIDLPFDLMKKEQDRGVTVLVLSDGEVEMKTQEAILNILFWYPFIYTGMPVYVSDSHRFPIFKSDIISDVHTHVYNRLLDCEISKEERLDLIFQSYTRMLTFIRTFMAQYHQTFDMLGLVDIRQHPEVKKYADFQSDPKQTILQNSDAMKRATDSMIEVLLDTEKVGNHQLYPFLKSDNIKKEQFGQVFIAYGPRTDIDSSIKSHFINNSALSGIKGVDDYATELLAAKKAQYSAKTSIADSQALGRRLRILMSPLKNIHRGWCGNKQTVPLKVTENISGGLEYNAIVEKGKTIYLTPQQAKDRIGKTVALVDPSTCYYTDGVCEYCVGWGYGRLYDYFPNAMVGGNMITWLVNMVSQALLSTKHRSSTTAVKSAFSTVTAKYFHFTTGKIYVNEKHKNNDRMALRVPLDNIRPLTDLQEDYSEMVSAFSELDDVSIVDMKYKKAVDEFNLSSEHLYSYLSAFTLNNIEGKQIYDENYLYVPFSMMPDPEDGPAIMTVAISADMEAYAHRLKQLIENSKSGLCIHNTISGALGELATHVYTQNDMNITVLQMLIKAMLLDPAGGSYIPQVTDINKVKIGNLPEITSRRSTTMKMISEAFKQWIDDPETYLVHRGESDYDYLFGFHKGRVK